MEEERQQQKIKILRDSFLRTFMVVFIAHVMFIIGTITYDAFHLSKTPSSIALNEDDELIWHFIVFLGYTTATFLLYVFSPKMIGSKIKKPISEQTKKARKKIFQIFLIMISSHILVFTLSVQFVETNDNFFITHLFWFLIYFSVLLLLYVFITISDKRKNNIHSVEEIISKIKNAGNFYPWVLTSEKYQKLLAVQSKPEQKFFFKDKEITLEKLIEILEKIEIE